MLGRFILKRAAAARRAQGKVIQSQMASFHRTASASAPDSGGKPVPINITKGASDPVTVSDAERPDWLNLKTLESELLPYEDLLRKFNQDEDSLSYREFKRLWRLANVRRIKANNLEGKK